MQFSSVLFAFATVSGAYAASQTVLVGDGGSLAFSPSSISNVQAGDSIIFEFRAKNHSVTQSSFASPCAPLPGGSNSGFQAVTNTSPPFPQWSITIQNTSAPLWFYCAQTNPIVHCQSGMVFAINPTADKSFNAFQAAANASTSAPPPPGAPAPAGTSASTGAAGGSGAPGAAPGDSSAPGAAPGGSGAPPSGAPVVSSGGSPANPSGLPGSPAVNPGGPIATSSGTQSSGSSNTATTSDGSAASPSPSNNGALHMGVSASGILALGGLIAGLMF